MTQCWKVLILISSYSRKTQPLRTQQVLQLPSWYKMPLMISGQKHSAKSIEFRPCGFLHVLSAHKRNTGLLSILVSETFCGTDFSGMRMASYLKQENGSRLVHCLLPPLSGQNFGQEEGIGWGSACMCGKKSGRMARVIRRWINRALRPNYFNYL